MSEKIKINFDDNNMAIYREWIDKAESVTRDTLDEFISHVMDDYAHCYDSYIYAVTAAAIATTYACGTELSGIQAGFIAKMYPLYFYYVDNRSGIGIKNYDLMLYPQYQYLFEKQITPKTWKALQAEAKARLDDVSKHGGYVSEEVMKHWISIANGTIPFGYELTDTWDDSDEENSDDAE